MDRDVALRIDGMIMGVHGNLDGIAFYLKNNLPDHEYAELVRSIGRAMAELIDISQHLHSNFPDIVPNEVKPQTRGETDS